MTFLVKAGFAFVGLSWFVGTANGTGYSYPFSYFNISTDKSDVGFVQIFACSVSQSTIYFSMSAGVYNQFKLVEDVQTFNLTVDYNKIKLTEAVSRSNVPLYRNFGLIVASDSETFVYGVKADVGTTDGFLVLPLTKNSTEFVIAGWRVANQMFFAGIQVIAALPDTCFEVYQINGSGQYIYYMGGYLDHAYSFNELYLDVNVDVSVLYVNSSRPVTVLSGVSCGNVPTSVLYCDHMVEAIPPISELGTTHVVPPIIGRSSTAGYLVRVVASQPNTTVDWTQVGGIVTRGEASPGTYYDISVADASVPILVVCSRPCVVMQYNKGYQATPRETSNTDPFMMIITPVDHYVNSSCFGTANFCYKVATYVDFYNFLAVATTISNKQSILFNGSMVLSNWIDVGTYSVSVQPINHGFWSISTVAGTSATFGAWVYGHSKFFESTSAYGYPVAYKVFGEPVDSMWSQAQELRVGNTKQTRVATCQSENITNGSAIATYSLTVGTPWVVYHSLHLNASLKSGVTISQGCRTAYIKAFRDLMTTTFRYINYQICTQSMCPYVTGTNGVVVLPGDFSAGISPSTMFVAIDTASLYTYITFDGSSNNIIAIHLEVPYVSTLDTSVDSFTRCRTEIRDFLIPFVNWMTINNNGFVPASSSTLSSSSSQASLSQQQRQLIADNQLIVAPSSCPALSFIQASFTYSVPVTCSNYANVK